MASTPTFPVNFIKGRGAGSNRESRFLNGQHQTEYDGWSLLTDEEDFSTNSQMIVNDHSAKTIISRNDSPDIGFTQSINPYLGCEHGCIYCYARPSHAYLGLSPGRDFETKLFAKANAARILKQELSKPSYVPSVVALGANTDPYQPIERKRRITREILEVLSEFNVPVSITTKSALITRDADILEDMARRKLARVNISIATLDPELARKMDPRAPTPSSRMDAIRKLAEVNIPVAVFTSPMIPTLTDIDLEKILEGAAEAGAAYASFVMLRLPAEVRDLFVEWLNQHFPLRAKHVMSLITQVHGGKEYNSNFNQRMKGSGFYADMIAKRFNIATNRLGLNKTRLELDTSKFYIPRLDQGQLPLF